MSTATKINIIVIIIIIIIIIIIKNNNNNNNSNNNNNTKATNYTTSLKVDAHKNIDGQNNNITKELMDSILIIERLWDPV